MTTIRTLAFALIVAVSAAASTAQAGDIGQYRVDAGETEYVDLNVCTSAKIDVTGTGRTDLDFVIRNSRGRVVHNDNGDTDFTSVELTSRRVGSCETFVLEVYNAGNRNSGFVVVMN
jgi:hypothetical protein